MSETRKLDPPWVNSNLHLKNRSRFPPEELAKYMGMQVAWDLEGTRIVAAGEDYPQLFKALDDLGIDQSRVVLSYVPTEDEMV